ncbi:MAG TPA: ketopantoate reductase C-terminal domain-containing protein, partial [Nocardioides sp.]|nr:ketopantoate reductase C-terminal domain-containing protein [Nocardioides sp.]
FSKLKSTVCVEEFMFLYDVRGRPEVDGPNSLGQSLAREMPTEVDFRAGEVVLLGRLHRVPTPVTERLQQEVHRLARSC